MSLRGALSPSINSGQSCRMGDEAISGDGQQEGEYCFAEPVLSEILRSLCSLRMT